MTWLFLGVCGIAAVNGVMGIRAKKRKEDPANGYDDYVMGAIRAVIYLSCFLGIRMLCMQVIGWWPLW